MKHKKILFCLIFGLFWVNIYTALAQTKTTPDTKITNTPVTTERRAADPPPAQVLCCYEAADGTISCQDRTCPSDVISANCCPEQATATGIGSVISTIKLDAEQSKAFMAGKDVNVQGKIISRKRAKHMRTWAH